MRVGFCIWIHFKDRIGLSKQWGLGRSDCFTRPIRSSLYCVHEGISREQVCIVSKLSRVGGWHWSDHRKDLIVS